MGHPSHVSVRWIMTKFRNNITDTLCWIGVCFFCIAVIDSSTIILVLVSTYFAV